VQPQRYFQVRWPVWRIIVGFATINIQPLQPLEVLLISFRGRNIGPYVRKRDRFKPWAGGGDGHNGFI
jgi:hypothetical protein